MRFLDIDTGYPITFSNSNGITFGTQLSKVAGGFEVITASYSQSTAPGAIAAGTQTASSGTIVLSNSNNLSFGMSGSTRITASYNFNLSAGTTSNNLNAVTFSNSNNVSFGLNGSTVTASASYSQSTSPGAIQAGTQTATSGTVIFSNSNNVSFGMSNSSVVTASASYSQSTAPGAIQAGTQTATSGTVVFSNSNGITFGMSGSSQVTASYNSALVYALGVSTDAQGNTGSNSGTFWFSEGAGNIQLSQVTSNNGSNTIALTVQAAALADSAQTATSGTVEFSNSNNVSFGMAGSTRMTASYNFNASAGTTSNNLNSLVFSNANGLVFGLNGSTITASHAGLSHFEPYGIAVISNTAFTSHQPASWWVNPVILEADVAFSAINVWHSFNASVPAATSVASTGTERYSYSQGVTVLSRNGFGASSTQLSYFTTASFGLTAGLSYSSTSQSFVMSWVTNSTGGTSSFNTTSSSGNWSSFITGPKLIQIPFNTTLTQGEYFFAFNHSSTSGTTNSNVTLLSISNLHFTAQSLTYGILGFSQASFSSNALEGLGYGVASAMTTNNSMAMTVISANVASGGRLVWNGSNAPLQSSTY